MKSLSQFLNRSMLYVRLWLRWIAEPSSAWVAIGVIALALLAPFPFSGAVENSLRYSGLLLQLLGIGTVAMGVRDKGKIFGKATMWQWVGSWFRRPPKWRSNSVTLRVDSMSHAHASSSARVWQWRNARDSLTLEDKLDLVIENLETLKVEWQAAEKRQGQEIRLLQTAVDAERTTREAALSKVTMQLNELGSGGLRMEAIGLTWLVAGVVFATIPQELARLLN